MAARRRATGSGGACRAATLAGMSSEELPVAEFAFPGPLRDQLVAAILAGRKTTTSGLAADYELQGEPLPRPGLRQVVVDSAGDPVAVIETTAVRVVRLADVDLAHALGEGEGYASVAEWRATSGTGTPPRCARRWATWSSGLTTTLSWSPRPSGWLRNGLSDPADRRC